MKRPAFQFYPADWRKDAALQSCSVAAQGLWINALCIAHECEPYGHLTVNAKAMTPAQIGRLVGLAPKDCEKLLAELLEAGVSSVAADGAVFSRRMVRDEAVRETRVEIGKANGIKGKDFGALGGSYGGKGGRPRGGSKPPQNPPPSSSSSSSNTPLPPKGGRVFNPEKQEIHSLTVPAVGEPWRPDAPLKPEERDAAAAAKAAALERLGRKAAA